MKSKARFLPLTTFSENALSAWAFNRENSDATD